MLSKFSVRKPFTVLVAVVICLVLGFLSFQNMSNYSKETFVEWVKIQYF